MSKTTQMSKDEGGEGRRVCRTIGARGRHCAGYVLKHQDYCRKCLIRRQREVLEPPAPAPEEEPVTIDCGSSVDVAALVEARRQEVLASPLDEVIARMHADLAVLERARAILAQADGRSV